jgi:hypothetical protein
LWVLDYVLIHELAFVGRQPRPRARRTRRPLSARQAGSFLMAVDLDPDHGGDDDDPPLLVGDVRP